MTGLFAAADPADPCVTGLFSERLRMEIRVLQAFHRGSKGSEGDQCTHRRRPTGHGQRLRPGRSQRGRVAEAIRKKGGWKRHQGKGEPGPVVAKEPCETQGHRKKSPQGHR